ncbi:MAG TPA: type VII secretion integral membrane protein EccD [Pseudonocardiaceae bacterium]|nr:type VII secretion integral membrane protein EccD [Pseudonocardiaceae bacterium]
MATGTTVFSRVTVVAPRTRIDVALPADVAVADLLPMLLEMAKEVTPDGGARHGGWCVARLGEAPLEPSRTLASLGVVDGDLLQLRRRSENPPPPLYDDVVDAIAESTPDSYRPWTKEIAQRFGHVTAALALIAAAIAALMSGPVSDPTSNGIAAAIAAGAIAIISVIVGATITRSYGASKTGVIIAAAGGMPMALVSGLYVVPHGVHAANYLLACVFLLLVSLASIMVMGSGVTVFVAGATAGLLGALTFTAGVFLNSPPWGVAGVAAAIALAALSVLPRLTIWMAKLPLPHVPGNAEDLKEDSGFSDYTEIERRAGRAHEFMTGMIIGCGVTSAVGAVIAATDPAIWGVIEGAAIAVVLMLRGRTYANGSQAVALLSTGILTAAGLLLGWLFEATPTNRLMMVFGVLIVLAIAGLVIGIVFPDQRFSPVMRRTVDTIEMILIASVLPLALAVLNLYSTFRHLHFGG